MNTFLEDYFVFVFKTFILKEKRRKRAREDMCVWVCVEGETVGFRVLKVNRAWGQLQQQQQHQQSLLPPPPLLTN